MVASSCGQQAKSGSIAISEGAVIRVLKLAVRTTQSDHDHPIAPNLLLKTNRTNPSPNTPHAPATLPICASRSDETRQ